MAVYRNIKDAPYNAQYNGTNESAILQAAINDAALAGEKKVYVPAGTIIAEVVLKHQVKLVGDGMRATNIKAVAGSTNKYAVTIDGGAVAYSGIEDLCILGVNNPGQGGFGAVASKGPQVSGGLWYSVFHNVDIRGFDGADWAFIGGHDPSAQVPNQFVTLINCYGSRASAKQALLMEGQCQHFTFINCSFEAGDVSNKGTGWGALLQRKRDALGVVMGDTAPSTVQFLNGTFQNGDIGLKVERSTGILCLGCYFENLDHAFYASTSAQVNIENSNFGNAGQDSTAGGTGYCVAAISDARVTVEECTFVGTQDRTYLASSPKALTTRGNTGEVNVTGITGQFGINASNTVDVRGLRTALINTSTTPLKTILTEINVGESIQLMAWGSSQTLTLQTGGNLTLGNVGSVVLNHKQVATFTRFDLGGSLVLTSVF